LRRALRGAESPGSLPLGEVLHPVTLLAAAVLALNDWIVKPSAAPRWLSGKLSDVAGLVVAPLILTAAVGLVLTAARRLGATVNPSLSRRRLHLSLLATAATFVLAKGSTTTSAWVEAAWGLAVPGRADIVADVTDLLALPALAVALWIGHDELRASARSNPGATPARAPDL
jgi:hypothetical protein